MKKPAVAILVLSLLGAMSLSAQTGQTAVPAQEKPSLKAPAPFTFTPAGRRDPFKDLLSGATVRDKNEEGQVSVEDLIVIGVIKSKKGFTAIVGTNQGFPSFVNVGDKFSDGYVLSINENQVVFRKTHERGAPLMRPRDIVREITPEER